MSVNVYPRELFSKVKMIKATNLNIADILHANKLIVSKDALEQIQEVYGDS